jgi:hypothetical protein
MQEGKAHDPRLGTQQNNKAFLSRAVRRRIRYVSAAATALALAVPALAILLNIRPDAAGQRARLRAPGEHSYT